MLKYRDIMGDSLDGSENTPEAQNVVVVDFQDFANYLRRAATVLLPEDDIVPPTLNAALDDKVYQDCIRKFITDPQVSSLYVQRFSSKGEIITSDKCTFALLFLLHCINHALCLLYFPLSHTYIDESVFFNNCHTFCMILFRINALMTCTDWNSEIVRSAEYQVCVNLSQSNKKRSTRAKHSLKPCSNWYGRTGYVLHLNDSAYFA